MPRKSPEPAPETPEDPLADLRESETPSEVQEEHQEPETLANAVGEAMGAVSVCWDPTPGGVFQSEQAAAIVNDLLGKIAHLAPTQRLVTQEEWEETRNQVIAALHADSVAQGFVHSGTLCGCRYLAGVILGVVLPAVAEPEPQGE